MATMYYDEEHLPNKNCLQITNKEKSTSSYTVTVFPTTTNHMASAKAVLKRELPKLAILTKSLLAIGTCWQSIANCLSLSQNGS